MGFKMKIYQVGGAVRDSLLGKEPKDFDYVVVGSNPDELIQKGFLSVGKNFPVFLHPKTKHEYALARKEIKTGNKHSDFEFIFDETITLEEDVMRRDFRMNALAMDEETGEIIDYVGGKKDIENKIIRHIHAEHFKEDPLRVLRMCRFAASLNFEIDEETMQLAKEMVQEGALSYLSKERVFNEFEKALSTQGFDIFISKMRECGALKEILPEIDGLFAIPEKEDFHPEKNTGDHTLLALKEASSYSPIVKFAVLLHDVGKLLTPQIILPSHYGHDAKGVELIKEICARLKVPKKYEMLAALASEYHMVARKAGNMPLIDLYCFVSKISRGFKRKESLENLFLVCKADVYGRGKLLEQQEFDNLDSAQIRSARLFDEVKKINLMRMPDFDKARKDNSFKSKADTYILNILEAKKI